MSVCIAQTSVAPTPRSGAEQSLTERKLSELLARQREIEAAGAPDESTPFDRQITISLPGTSTSTGTSTATAAAGVHPHPKHITVQHIACYSTPQRQ